VNDTTTVTFPALELRIADPTQRIIEGIVVPWDEITYMTPHAGGERFRLGSLTRTVTERGDRIKLFRNHDHSRAVGRAVAWDAEHPDGCWGQFKIAGTAAGDDVLAEIGERMLDAFSIGFRPLQAVRGDHGVRDVTEASLHEVSLCPIGAYDGARVLAMRTPGRFDPPAPMPDVNLGPIPLLR
jgi:HK97 family phage prohead protease